MTAAEHLKAFLDAASKPEAVIEVRVMSCTFTIGAAGTKAVVDTVRAALDEFKSAERGEG
jgi:hypothetical protein